MAKFPSPVGECDFKFDILLIKFFKLIKNRFRPLSGNVILNTGLIPMRKGGQSCLFPSPVGECDFKFDEVTYKTQGLHKEVSVPCRGM